MRTRTGPPSNPLRLAAGNGVNGRRESGEDRVALGVDLHAAVPGDRVAQDPAVLGERTGVVRGAELVEEPCRALDIGKEEGDGTGR